jgi:hypothetical protein
MSISLIFRLLAFSVNVDQARALHVAERPELAEEYRWRSSGETAFVLAGESGDNRTFDMRGLIARRWQLLGIGNRSTLITEACRTAVDCEDGGLRFANSKWTSPENYIAAIRKTLKEAIPIEQFRRESLLDLLVDPAEIRGGEADPVEGAASSYASNGYLRHLVDSGALVPNVATRHRPSLTPMSAWEEQVLPHYRVQLRLDGSGQASAVIAALAEIPDLVWDRVQLHQGSTEDWDRFLNGAYERQRAA